MNEEEEPKDPVVTEDEGSPEATEAPTEDEAPADEVEVEVEEAAPVSEHAGLINDMDRLLCTYYSDQVANDLMNLVVGQDVLLVGCEDGYVISSLALAGHNVVALDFDPANLRKVKKVLRGWHQIKFVRLEGRSFPFDDGSFDTVLVSLFAHHATNPARVFEEGARVLRPDGRLVLADLVKHEETWMMDTLHDVWLGFTEEEVSGWMEDAAFKEIVTHNTGAKCSGPDFEEHDASVDILIMTAAKGPD
jgi:SAM-dependent methyltransferase